MGIERTRRFVIGFAAGLAAVTSVAAGAADAGARSVVLRGFGTLGAVHSNAKDADFVSGFFEPNGAGHTSRWAAGIDSKLGLQLDAALGERLSAVLQVVSLHRHDNSYRPKIEWANVKYQLTPDLDVRVGRTVAMPFMVSDARQVGYANTWMRPPQEVYGLIPITNKDGVDATYKVHWGPVTNSLHASYGGTRLDLPESPTAPGEATVKARQYFDIADTVEHGPFTARVSYSTGKVDLHTPGLQALVNGYDSFGDSLGASGFASAAAQARATAEKYRFENAPISVIAAGASYDRDRWLLMGEWARFNGHSLLADSTAWYVTAAYRLGAWTPYATLARLDADRRTEEGVSPAGLPPPFAAGAATLNAGLNAAIAAAAFAQKSFSAGLRWDVAKNAAFKVQYDRLHLAAWSSGRLGNVQSNFQPGGKVNVIGFTVDFVF